MAIIVNPVDFNPSALTAPDVYLEVIPPQAYIPGAPASVSAVLGTASWGPLNQANLISNITSLVSTYGTISAASVDDIHDLATDIVIALDQAGQAGLSLQAVRVSDGTDIEATADLVDNSPVETRTVTVGGTVTHPFQTATVTIGGTATPTDVLTLRFIVALFDGAHEDVSYTVGNTDTLADIAAGLTAAINADTVLSNAGVSAAHTALSDIFTITIEGIQAGPTVTDISAGGNSETVGIVTADTQDVLTLRFTSGSFGGGHEDVHYTVNTGDTLNSIALGLKNAINADSVLTAANISAAVLNAVVTVTIPGPILPTLSDASAGSPTETLTIGGTGSNPVTGGTLNAIYSGILGNQIVCQVLPGTHSNLVNVLLTAWQGKAQEFYVGLPNSSAFWAALQVALAGGMSSTVGPSQLCRFTPATMGSPGAPHQGIVHLSGGTDGRAVDTADLIGENDVVPPTGIYCTTNLFPSIQQIWVAGLTDATAFPDLDAFGQQNGIAFGVAAPINTTITQFINILNTAGLINWECFAPLDWVLFFDAVNNVQRFVTPLPYVMGAITALSPEQSPLNLPLFNVQATPRSQQGAPYSTAEIGLANSNGILLINNPIPLGNTFGIRTATNRGMTVNAAQGPVEYTRMTNFLIQSFGAVLGQFEGKLQTQQKQDPLRAAVRNLCNNFLNELQGNNQIDAYNVICDFSQVGGPGLNTPQTIAQHILNVAVQVRYMSSVWFLIFTLQGGTTVQISSSVISPGATS